MTDWREKRKRREIRTSATQHETFEMCHRKWWLQKVRRLPDVGTSHAQAFGTVVHGVCERYLSADDLGRDSKGNPVDLYPEGWHIAINRYGIKEGEISVAEQALVKKLIAAAIEEGVLERRPHRQVEKPFRMPIWKSDDGVNVQIEGFIDVHYPDTIEDHKTSKSTRWLKSPKALADNLQVLVYAKVLLDGLVAEGRELPEYVTIRHNQFIKDPDRPLVRKTEVQVPVSRIQKAWEDRIIANAQQMDRYRRTAEVWSDIPDPQDPSKACNAYGGCEFRRICSGKESEEGYENRVARIDPAKYISVSVDGQQQKYTGATIMDLKGKLAQRQAERQARGPAPSINSPKSEAKKDPPKAAVQKQDPPKPLFPAGQWMVSASGPDQSAWDLDMTAPDGTPLRLPPWVDPANPVSSNNGLGFSSSGAPCAMSSMRAKKAGYPTADMFDLEPLEDGTVYWVGKDGTPAAGMEGRSPLSLELVEAEVEGQERSGAVEEPEERAEEPETDGEVSSDPEEQGESEDEEGGEEPKASKAETARENGKKGGRPKKSFIMVINAAPSMFRTERKGSGRYVYSLHEVFGELCQSLADSEGVSSFYAIDVFRRRDRLAAVAPELAETFGQDIVYVTLVGSGASDIRALVDALIPLASQVFYAVS